MLKELLKNPRALVYAVLVHAALIAVLVLSIQWNSKPVPLQGSGEIVQAKVIDEAKLQADKQRKFQEEQRKRNEEQAKRQAELDKQRAAQEAVRKQQQEAERQRQAKIKADQDAKERQHIAAQKRLAEQDARRRAEERHAAQEAKRKAEAQHKAEAQRKADEARRQREDLQRMQQQMAQEEADRAAQAMAEQQRREMASKMNRYVLQLQNIINRNWIRPASSRSGLVCTVHVRLIPGGDVVDARVTKSSGDLNFDRSAETAVLKSSPLPSPPDPSLREFDFKFNPEG